MLKKMLLSMFLTFIGSEVLKKNVLDSYIKVECVKANNQLVG